MNKVHYAVGGLRNEQTKTQLKNALAKIYGVQMVNIDMGKGSVEVGFSEPADAGQVESCIIETGFRME